MGEQNRNGYGSADDRAVRYETGNYYDYDLTDDSTGNDSKRGEGYRQTQRRQYQREVSGTERRSGCGEQSRGTGEARRRTDVTGERRSLSRSTEGSARSSRGSYAGSPERGRGSSGGNSRRSRNTPGRGRRRRRGQNKTAAVVLIVITLIVLLLAAIAWKAYQKKYGYSDEKADLYSYYGLSGDGSDAAVMHGNELSDTHAKLIGDRYYLTIDAVQSLLNKRFYYGSEDNMVFYALPDKLITTTVGSNTYETDGTDSVDAGYPLTVLDGDTLYLALDFVQMYTNFTYTGFTDPNRIQLDTSWGDVTTALIKADTNVRTSGGVKSPILTPVKKGSTVTVLTQYETWSQVKTDDAYIGYVENKFLDNIQTVAQTPNTNYTEPVFPDLKGVSGLVNMGWHNVISTDGNASFGDCTANVKSMNVISPTWFPLAADDGTLSSYATQTYMDEAHAKGLQVWPAVDNFNDPDITDHGAALRTYASRQKMISQLIGWADEFGFEGINVDFENLEPADGQNFIEFIRELSIAMHRKNLVLSVDNYVTFNFNDFYHMDELADFADYVVIMGYDEHTAGDPEAGSTADLEYVRYGIKRCLEEVPADKVINGIPFYMRLVIDDTNGNRIDSQLLDMKMVQSFYAQHPGATGVWDAKLGQTVYDFVEGDRRYQLWVEDAQSVQAKLEVMQANGIAGVAEWKLSQETADVWDVIEKYMNGQLSTAGIVTESAELEQEQSAAADASDGTEEETGDAGDAADNAVQDAGTDTVSD